MADMPGTVHLRAYRGDDWIQQFRFVIGSNPVDFTGATLAATARNDKGSHALVVAPIVTNPDNGFLNLSMPPGWIPPGMYDYDIEVTLSGGEVTTWVRGRLFVERDVTNELPNGPVP